MDINSILIIGGGLSGFTVAQNLRTRGYDGTLGIVDPDGIPYDRPPLSKAYLLGQKDAGGIALAPESWYTQHDVEIITGTARELLLAESKGPDAQGIGVRLTDDRELYADRIVLALGGQARTLPIEGGDLDSVLVLRDRADADKLRSKLHPGTHLAIIGAGLIGAEVASAALKLGATVSLIDPIDPPLIPAVGQELARKLHDMHTPAGITTVQGTPARISCAQGMHTVELVDGTLITAHEVLVGIGMVPNTSMAQVAGLETDHGIIVDEHQRTSDSHIYAVGDASRTRTTTGELLRRAEHWEYAMNTGATAAASLSNQELPQHGASWFWSDRHGVHVEGVGEMNAQGTTILRFIDDSPVAAFRLGEHGKLVGAAAIDGGLTIRAARRIIDRGIIVDPVALADPNIPLKKLAR
ncbi:assimilatory nitrite reductase subunit [Arthrobacter sp. MYb227]|uniref:NAD(P)/FAD-dependent oxidoreductase n=1 Tax=Arthrobacter sp. MYb227 TaxID=1848601 RepID=UPI000CFDDFC3|nr:FAD-dependent oxidoreductase [Arthrobacter sp. MYb227]PQZ95039.1 assimilatory nitrite reductase subunit [Arthrobacter sp. MYb227]